jgi:hypothetical protein
MQWGFLKQNETSEISLDKCPPDLTAPSKIVEKLCSRVKIIFSEFTALSSKMKKHDFSV